MECRGCCGKLEPEAKNGLCQACTEHLDRWVYECIAKEMVAQDQEVADAVKNQRKAQA